MGFEGSGQSPICADKLSVALHGWCGAKVRGFPYTEFKAISAVDRLYLGGGAARVTQFRPSNQTFFNRTLIEGGSPGSAELRHQLTVHTERTDCALCTTVNEDLSPLGVCVSSFCV